MKNIKRYAKYYLPKYTCAFLNRNIKGCLFIGVNDFGFTKGIPYQGELPIDKIKKKMLKVIKKRVRHDFINLNFEKLVNIHIYKIISPIKPDLDNPQLFTDFIKQKEKFIIEYNSFINKLENWKIKMNFFTQKLVDLVNNLDSRILLIEYIRTFEPINPVIKILESDFILKYNDNEEIANLKDDQFNIYYWICKWKDEMVDNMKNNKPSFNDNNFISSIPYNLIISVSEMIPYWMNYNSNMNLYIIYVEINTFESIYQFNCIDNLIQYKTPNDNNWISCYRNMLLNGEPTCTPLNLI
jgi:hypothetical protein